MGLLLVEASPKGWYWYLADEHHHCQHKLLLLSVHVAQHRMLVPSLTEHVISFLSSLRRNEGKG